MSGVELYVATEWVSAAVRAVVDDRMTRDPRRSRLHETEVAWKEAQEAVAILMTVGGPAAVAPQTTLLVAPQQW